MGGSCCTVKDQNKVDSIIKLDTNLLDIKMTNSINGIYMYNDTQARKMSVMQQRQIPIQEIKELEQENSSINQSQIVEQNNQSNNDENYPLLKTRHHGNDNLFQNRISQSFDLTFSAQDFVTQKQGNINEEYTLQTPALGKGAFGEVRKAIHKKTGITRAVKMILKHKTKDEDRAKLLNEVEMLKKLDHPNILKVYEFYQDQSYFYIVTELCTGGELFDKLIQEKYFSEQQAADIMRQILQAIYYCHTHNIVHRDVKPENLLYESNKPNALLKMIDFGTSTVFEEDKKMSSRFGTPYYIAPEVLQKSYDYKCDMWSCGIISYILLCGYPPFNGPNDKAIMDKVEKGVYNFNGKEWATVSNEAKDFIQKLLQVDPNLRYNSRQALQDPWIKNKATKTSISQKVAVNVLENLKNFQANSQNKFQSAIWVYLISSLTSKEENQELLKIFQVLDVNGDGSLTKEELVQGYKNILNVPNPEEEVDKIFQIVDTNKSGTIDFTEFVVATIGKKNYLNKQRLEAAFKLFDIDGSGQIEIQELREIFHKANLSVKDWQEIIKEVDENGDGQISFNEFKQLMLQNNNS